MSINHDIMRRAAYVERAVRRAEDPMYDRREGVRAAMEAGFAQLQAGVSVEDTFNTFFPAIYSLRRFPWGDAWSQWMKQLVFDALGEKIPLADTIARYERLKFNLPHNRTNPGG